MRHEELAELILQFEDLTDDERELATAHLAECSECRGLMADLQSAERTALSAADLPALPPDPDGDPTGGLRGDDLRQAQASRTQLLAKVRRSRRSRRLSPLGWGGLALAATVVLALWLPQHDGDGLLVRELRLAPATALRGVEGAPLAVGDAFSLRFTLAASGRPVVVRLDAAGQPEVLYPSSVLSGELAAERPLILPPPGAPVTWRVRDPATTVWLALDREPSLDVGALRRELVAFQSAAKVTAYLRDRFGPAAVSVATLSVTDPK